MGHQGDERMNRICEELQAILSAIGRHIDDFEELEWMQLYAWVEDVMLLSSKAEIRIMVEEE